MLKHTKVFLSLPLSLSKRTRCVLLAKLPWEDSYCPEILLTYSLTFLPENIEELSCNVLTEVRKLCLDITWNSPHMRWELWLDITQGSWLPSLRGKKRGQVTSSLWSTCSSCIGACLWVHHFVQTSLST